MRMTARVNISIPDELLRRAREAGLNISKLARDSIADELDRRAKIAAVDEYLAELEAELGPIGAQEQAAADAWADEVFGPRQPGRRTA
jgi:post-segregation antitoxin (ccd killing protein)